MLTRLAPSPTGALHVGNVRTFLLNWLLARQRGWRIILRIEDLDGPRIKPESIASLLDDLRWLGLDWDDGPLLQSTRSAAYAAAIAAMMRDGHAYPCVCTRREVDQAASAPHADDGASVYPGTCRGRFASVEQATKAAGRPPVIRFRVPDDALVEWDDGFAGHRRYAVARELGDFVIAKADGTPAYQLAVVVDDDAADVTHVVRGDDLLDSTPRQILLYRALGRVDRIPTYTHLPLVVGPDGRRLAKRHGDSRVSFYRDRGVSNRSLVGAIARLSGMSDVDDASPRELIERFDLRLLPADPVTWSDEQL